MRSLEGEGRGGGDVAGLGALLCFVRKACKMLVNADVVVFFRGEMGAGLHCIACGPS